jgi:predicted Holliday junction resolvase-like endonuclease
MLVLILIGITALLVMAALLVSLLIDLKNLHQKQVLSVNIDTHPITAQLQQHTSEVKSELNTLPEEILRALTGSANTHKGKLGELIGYITLKAEYDKIIPLGTIIDFMCIKFSTPEQEGFVDFLDIKTGDSARLNKDQRALKNLIAAKKIRFKTIKIDSIDGLPDDGSSSDQPT